MRPYLWIYLVIVGSFALGMMVEAVRASMSDTAEARVTGIGGVFFKAREPQKLAGWYREHLGIQLEPAGSGPTAPSFCAFEWREKGDPQKAGETVFAIFSDKSKYFDPSQASYMINFRVANLDRILAQLKKEGATVEEKTSDESTGRFGWAIDPEGNRFELWEPKGN